MLSRFISKPSHHHLRLISFLISSQPHPPIPKPHLTIHSTQTLVPPCFRHFIKHLSTNNKNNNNGNNFIDSFNGDSKNENGDDLFKVGRPIRKEGLASENWVNQKDDEEDDLFKQVEGGVKEVSKRGLVNEDWVNMKDDDDECFDLFKEAEVGVKEVPKRGLVNEDWVNEKEDDEGFDLFKEAEESVKAVGVDGKEDNWATADGYEQWDLDTEEKGEDVFGLEEMEMSGGVGDEESEESKQEKLLREKEQKLLLEKEEKELSVVFNGPDRAFGDLVAKSGITEEMLESLIALKDLEGIQGLPPLSEIEDIRYEKNSRKSLRADIEREKQEEVANARMRQVDSKGRAYATGKRKCSIARVWIQPGEGKFVVNDKQFDVYFPMLEQRAALLRPFTETKTLGVWDVNCTVKGGGISGQVGAIRLGISRALQNWEPDLRPPLKEAGFLTRDSRVVERKKPGKAKARKSFQWVKR